MGADDHNRDAESVQRRTPRRRFLLWAASVTAAGTVSRAASATNAAWSIRDRWLFSRLCDRSPKVLPGVGIWPPEGNESPVGWLETGPIVALNETATFILARCGGDLTVSLIADDVAGAFGATIDEARLDVALTIRSLVRLGLVRV